MTGETGHAEKQSLSEEQASSPALTALNEQLPGVVQNARFDRQEWTLTVARESIVPACRALQSAAFNFMSDLSCVDWYPNRPRFQVTYHLLSMALKQRVRLIVMVDENDASVDSITAVWPAANFFEREIFDLFGVRFGGHPNLRRILMPDDFKGNPLRKDFPVEGYR